MVCELADVPKRPGLACPLSVGHEYFHDRLTKGSELCSLW